MTADMVNDHASGVRAFALLEKVLRLDPKRTEIRRRLIPVAIGISRFQDAKVHLEQLLKESPKDAELLFLLGQCDLGKGDFESAASNFKKVIDICLAGWKSTCCWRPWWESTNPVPKKPASGMTSWCRGIPRIGEPISDRGIYLAGVNDGEDAFPEALKALELQPDRSDVLLLASRCYLIKGDFVTSRRYAARGIELYPNITSMYVNMADLEAEARNHDKAIAIVRQGLAVTGQNLQLLWTLANRLIDANRLAEAKQTINDLWVRYDEASQEEQLRYKPLLEYLNWRGWRWPRDVGGTPVRASSRVAGTCSRRKGSICGSWWICRSGFAMAAWDASMSRSISSTGP